LESRKQAIVAAISVGLLVSLLSTTWQTASALSEYLLCYTWTKDGEPIGEEVCVNLPFSIFFKFNGGGIANFTSDGTQVGGFHVAPQGTKGLGIFFGPEAEQDGFAEQAQWLSRKAPDPLFQDFSGALKINDAHMAATRMTGVVLCYEDGSGNIPCQEFKAPRGANDVHLRTLPQPP